MNASNSTVPSILFTTSQIILNHSAGSRLKSILVTNPQTISIPSSSSMAQSITFTSGGTILNNQITAANTLYVVGNIFAPTRNLANQTPFTIIVDTPCALHG
jgi:hypothetical protein